MLFSTHKSKPLSRLAVRLWDIATGPSLQNFALEDSKKKVIGRISFKALMRQETDLVLHPSNITFSFLNQHKGRFLMTVKAVTEEGEAEMHLPTTDSMSWDVSYGDPDLNESSISFCATIETLRNASLQLKIRKVKKSNVEVQIAECWLTLSKLFKQEKYTVIKRDGPGYRSFNSKKESEVDLDGLIDVMKTYTVTRPFTEKLWYYGKEVGSISGQMTLMNIPLISQLITGVNTENGFMPQTSNFLENSAATPKPNQRATVPQEIVKLMGLTDGLTTSFASGDKREGSLLSSKGHEIREQINRVKDIIEILKESKKHSMTSFVYDNKTDLIVAQNAFMDLGEHLLVFADLTSYAVRPFYYEALLFISRRGELDLGSLAVTEDSEKQRNKKIPVGVRYRSFLRNMLICALGKLKIKGVDRRSQQFTEYVCAISYFRIPEFRRALLKCLREKSYETIGEWREVAREIDDGGVEEDGDHMIETHILPMFDWTHLLYQSLPSNPSEEKELKQALQDPGWKSRVAKRGLAYFRLISEWATHVKKMFPEKHIPWMEIPGYGVVVRTFLLEMRLRRMSEYPMVMEGCSLSLLNNPNLISVFIKVLFSKTNVYSIELISASFELCNLWFSCLYEEHHSLPLSFDESFFLQGLRITLTCDIAFNIAKAIWFLYRNYQLIPQQTKQEIVLDGFLRISEGIKLALHWGQTVRLTFWNLLAFRLIAPHYLRMDPLSPLDEEIYTKAIALTEFIQTLDPQSVDSTLRMYLDYSRKELTQTREKYENWLPAVQKELSSADGKKGPFGGLMVFPFPEMILESTQVDKSENRMDEEW